MEGSTMVRVRCEGCMAEGALAHEHVGLLLCETTKVYSWYFVCPRCNHITVQRVATQAVVEALIEGGSETKTYKLPIPSERPGGPPIVLDDILDFHLEIETAPNPLAELEDAA